MFSHKTWIRDETHPSHTPDALWPHSVQKKMVRESTLFSLLWLLPECFPMEWRWTWRTLFSVAAPAVLIFSCTLSSLRRNRFLMAHSLKFATNEKVKGSYWISWKNIPWCLLLQSWIQYLGIFLFIYFKVMAPLTPEDQNFPQWQNLYCLQWVRNSNFWWCFTSYPCNHWLHC